MSIIYRTALITGASSGIGAVFATQLAAAGSDLILVARRREELEKLAQQLRSAHGRRVEVIAMDLAKPDPGELLAEEVKQRGLEVDLLVNNAGFGSSANFHEDGYERDQRMIAVNIAALTELTHAFLPAMVQAGHGAVINIASAAAFQPMPYMSVYGATKAYVLSLTQALWAEYRGRGVRFLAVCPGPVDTPFFEAADSGKLRQEIPSAVMMTAEGVVSGSLRALQRDACVYVPGIAVKLGAVMPRLLPRRLLAATMGKVMNRR
ncbi:SDR family NAD(P)-dependent oxidoreductase [Solimonas sp. K1W22B-7]|uniref:SDR family NAD(P)-dependent oxidoreductase n=1 Tax=Solimonas sp. K1W22B-7 TaxID=2303331 RepID=UPI001F09EE2D|nr:SDR family oxidoreductase [Solimonas sp. K1W22B-7]